ncbi:hypothetical protein GCM10010272_13020 [Streptomyces lateritius]|nr:hypothetical protein GCM10010272_13020 [Streptomyces lateritius]
MSGKVAGPAWGVTMKEALHYPGRPVRPRGRRRGRRTPDGRGARGAGRRSAERRRAAADGGMPHAVAHGMVEERRAGDRRALRLVLRRVAWAARLRVRGSGPTLRPRPERAV